MKLERAGAETQIIEYFRDKDSFRFLYSRDSNGFWRRGAFGVWEEIENYKEIEEAYQELSKKPTDWERIYKKSIFMCVQKLSYVTPEFFEKDSLISARFNRLKDFAEKRLARYEAKE